MAKRFDPRYFLRIPFIYTTYQKLVGGYRARKLFVENMVRIKPNQKILDIGCGPGDILDFLPEVHYFGIDLDNNYIEKAKKKYQNRGTFICSGVTDFTLPELESFDIVIASGVLHHLNDEECIKLFEIAFAAIKPNGRVITYDGCYVENQNVISKAFLKLDRGKFVRTKIEYERLAKSCFPNVKSVIEEEYFRIPYTSIGMECRK
ncbi:class I SAM-dependent methyltransferase [Flavivirga abyssicola]|uniref:class I SAM-dependent methyltransferase n=1 Tax=Flavivirga abyssicola TaxID=3063533 RepID=UPI0026E0657A|nr:class I SAM-dependent methyltransferase [Flavivirga sp. MEBiC07777]WVK12033.1 class I SAM-dependent methyltransferase [Flavivirga sp. MEBiC07777]